MIIIIYGENGFIGTNLKKYLNKNKGIKIFKSSYKKINSKEQVICDINKIKPDCIVSCIGFVKKNNIISTSFLENDDYLFENLQYNMYIHNAIMHACLEKDVHFTYIGTGCIYSSTNNKIFKENDEPNFYLTKYSLIKGFTDKLIKLNDEVLLIRIRQCLNNCDSDQNFLNKFLKFNKVNDIQNSFTVIPSIFPLISKLIIQKKKGVFNCVNKGSISIKEINEIFNKKDKPIIKRDFAIKNFSNNILSTEKLEKLFKIEKIENAIIKLKENSYT